MRIAIVTDAWYPQVNGVVRTLNTTIGILNDWGYEVLCVDPSHFRTVPLPTYSDIRVAVAPGGRVADMLDRFAPQAIHISTEGPLGIAARRYCLRRGLAFTTAYHTRFPEYVRLRFPVPLNVSYRFMRWFHGRAKRTMVTTRSMAEELTARGFANLVAWSRGVDIHLFRPRRKSALEFQRPIFLFVGRVAVEKNIEAFLSLKLPGTKVVIGEGPALEDLRRRFPEARFLGFKTGEDLASHVAAADVMVFPSLTDTFGLVLLEAMASGVPVAAYPVPGPRDVVKHGQTGFIDGDLELAALGALEIEPDACRQHAVQFSWENCTRQFLDNMYPNEGHEQSVKPVLGREI
jgi:glycosyltransferase involved in cell wall biosynthesis